MIQNILNCEWSYFIILIFSVFLVIVRDEKENDILGKKFHKKMWQLPIRNC